MKKRNEGEVRLVSEIILYPLKEEDWVWPMKEKDITAKEYYEQERCAACEYLKVLKYALVYPFDVPEYNKGYSYDENRICKKCYNYFIRRGMELARIVRKKPIATQA